MDRRTANIVGERLNEVLAAAVAADPILSKYDVRIDGGRFGEGGLRSRLRVAPKIIAPPTETVIGTVLDDSAVRAGLAPTGTPIIYGYDNKKGTVIEARRTKYLFRDTAKNKEYVIAFRACRLDKSKLATTPKPIVEAMGLDKPAANAAAMAALAREMA